jgi:hypothetical protein
MMGFAKGSTHPTNFYFRALRIVASTRSAARALGG